jgi:hypothetical protein
VLKNELKTSFVDAAKKAVQPEPAASKQAQAGVKRERDAGATVLHNLSWRA